MRYAISDLHGHYELYKAVKERLKEDDILYVLGDCADRGPQGWKTLSHVLTDDQCILIMGNHEKMLYDAMVETKKLLDAVDLFWEEKLTETYKYQLLELNGGTDTFWDWTQDPLMEEPFWFKKIESLPYEIRIEDSECGRPIILTHAGYTPWIKPLSKDELLWDRHHFYDKWDEGKEDGDVIIIHGHTPQEYLLDELAFTSMDVDFEVLDKNTHNEWCVYDLKYADGHKICIDPGTIIGKQGLLINLDTLEQEVIKFDWRKDEAKRKEWDYA